MKDTIMNTIAQPTIILTPDLFSQIDHAGAINVEIKALEKQLETLKDLIKAQGAGKHAGFVFQAHVIDSNREKTDWQAIAEKLNPSRQLITAHTVSSVVQSIRFSKV
jgi:hypothetical protein